MNLSERFVEAAAAHGRFTQDGDPSACNRAHDRLMSIFSELKELPDHGLATLRKLQANPDISVRTWAATYLLPFDEAAAVAVLEDAVNANVRLQSFGASMVLQEWRAGRLKFVNWP